MLISIAFTAAVSFGGAALTYLFARDEGLLWRLAAGQVIGSVIFFFPAFFLFQATCLFAAAPWVLVFSLAIALSPLFLLKRRDIREKFRRERDVTRGKVQGATFSKLVRFAFYAAFLLLFIAFFSRAMIVATDGIFTGGSQNLGDLPFHLGAVYSFSSGCNDLIQNPSFAGATFTYPFTADFLTAVLVSVGADAASAMWVQNVAWAFALLVVLERFVFKVTQSKIAGKMAVPVLFFSGGFGFLWFLGDYWSGSQGLFSALWHLQRDYTIGEVFRWGNSLVTLFITQRSLLLGMPLTLVIAGYLWGELATHDKTDAETSKAVKGNSFSLIPAFVVGFLAGTLPLVHAHSLFVLFVISGCWFFFGLKRWKQWIAFGAGTALIALPELFWILSGSASHTSEFFGWHFGFDAGGQNLAWFWLKNTGLFIPLLLAAFTLLFLKGRPRETDSEQETKQVSGVPRLAVYYLPFLLLFIIANLFKLAPWQWDNIKVLIYWFAGSIPLVAFLLARFWKMGGTGKAVATILLFLLAFSGALDVWRTASGQIRNRVFSVQAEDLANWAKLYTEPYAVFLNAPTYNTAVALSGRISVMRYPGHLSSHGIDYQQRESDVKKIYAGGPGADELLKKYGVDYILLSPEVRAMMPVNEGFLRKFPVAHEEGSYRLYRVEKGS